VNKNFLKILLKKLKKFKKIKLTKELIKNARAIGVIGFLIIVIGIALLYNPTNINLKISASLIFIGILFIFEIDDKSELKKINGRYLTIILLFWILFLFIITIDIEYNAFFILAISGILIIKELLNSFISSTLKKRIKEISMNQSRKGGKYYEHMLQYERIGLRRERKIVRNRHRLRWNKHKGNWFTETEIHHEWLEGTANYRGIAIVDKTEHQHGIINPIEILEGTVGLIEIGGKI